MGGSRGCWRPEADRRGFTPTLAALPVMAGSKLAGNEAAEAPAPVDEVAAAAAADKPAARLEVIAEV